QFGGPKNVDNLRRRLSDGPDRLVAADFRLSPEAGDVGANVDLVGPGEGYERWKQTPAYKEWQAACPVKPPVAGNGVIQPANAPTPAPAKITPATQAADAWLKLLDDERYSEAWEQEFSVGQRVVKQEDFVRNCKQQLNDRGRLISRTLRKTELLPVGYVVVEFASKFTLIDPVFETVVMAQDADGRWRTTTYGATPQSHAGPAKPSGPTNKDRKDIRLTSRRKRDVASRICRRAYAVTLVSIVW
ncbi:MAG TPA: DUF4019 domain-containing protein, partial [Gemmataceae bacterium]|nr:DUF4019 domain-containing protein [Gemmataceae bacterium]